MDTIQTQVNIWIREFITQVSIQYPDATILLFGSRARNTHKKYSDIDIIVISDQFANSIWPRRLAAISDLWNGDLLLEPLCYTYSEFAKKKKQIGIIAQANKDAKILYKSPSAKKIK